MTKEVRLRKQMKMLETFVQSVEAIPRDPAATSSSNPRGSSSGTNFSCAADDGGNHGGDPVCCDRRGAGYWIHG